MNLGKTAEENGRTLLGESAEDFARNIDEEIRSEKFLIAKAQQEVVDSLLKSMTRERSRSKNSKMGENLHSFGPSDDVVALSLIHI